MEKQRFLSAEETQRIRDSVEKGVEKVVKPFLERVEAQSHIPPSNVRYKDPRRPNAAEPLMTPTPDNQIDPSIKPPTAQEVRESILNDARRLLAPLYKRVQKQRGLPDWAKDVRVKAAV